ncbi:helix-turn-helix domain-containing protein [Streptomyces sp. NPDC003300]|uniref:helix-turn-helix domain-containing protein n=1 Tax=unclassified Streptomyces TaxID=2593676 RepID=UPI0033B61A3C
MVSFRGGKYAHRARSSSDTFARLENTWNRAVSKAKESPAIQDPQQARQEIGLIRGSFRSVGLTGRTALTDTLVLEHLHKEATRRGLMVLYASVRDISEVTGIGRSTVSRSLGRLVKAGWLRHQGRELVSDASSYRLTQPSVFREDRSRNGTQTRRVSTGREDCVPLRDSALGHVSEDLFLRLGRHSALVYAVTGEDPLTAKQVQDLSGVSKATVFRHLRTLVELGLVEKTATAYMRTHRGLAKAAADIGAVGLGEERTAKIASERKLWSKVAEGVQFKRDLDRWGKRVAVENALRRRGEPIPAGVDLETGEILEVLEEGRCGRELTDPEVEEAMSPAQFDPVEYQIALIRYREFSLAA